MTNRIVPSKKVVIKRGDIRDSMIETVNAIEFIIVNFVILRDKQFLPNIINFAIDSQPKEMENYVE